MQSVCVLCCCKRDNQDGVLGACEGDVEAARVVEETDALMVVRAHAGENDEVLFAALERVHARHLDLLV